MRKSDEWALLRGGLRGAVVARCGLGVAALWIAGVAPSARAQETAATAFPDVPANHWAYQAVQDLAAKGYVKGYADGQFLGKRVLTRYEFAQVIERMVRTIGDLNARIAAQPTDQAPLTPNTPNGRPITLDDLNKLQTLVDTFKAQIDANTTDITILKSADYQGQIAALRNQISALQNAVARAQAGADRAYGYGPGKFQIGGFLQARFEQIESGNETAYPNGTSTNVGPAQSYNGNYAVGGGNQAFFVRRARLRLSGAVSEHARYSLLFDASNSSTTNPIDVREVSVAYTFGDGDAARHPTLIAGQFANLFGFVLNESNADFIGIERPMVLSDASSGLWQNQDFDRGVGIAIPVGAGFKASASVINGTGRGTAAGVSTSALAAPSASSVDNKRRPDKIYRLAYQPVSVRGLRTLGIGASYYDGEISRSLATNVAGSPTFIGTKYDSLHKSLAGADISLKTNSGILLQGEYVSGRFDERTYVSSETGSAVGTALIANAYAPGNKVDGYYGWLGYVLPRTAEHAATLALSYDVFDRSRSGIRTGQTDSNGAAILGGASGGSFTDKNWGYGASYNLDRTTQIKLWYDRPAAVSHAANLPEPQKIGIFTAQLQLRF